MTVHERSELQEAIFVIVQGRSELHEAIIRIVQGRSELHEAIIMIDREEVSFAKQSL
jgi:hypothetical protein